MAATQIYKPPLQVDVTKWEWKKWFEDLQLYINALPTTPVDLTAINNELISLDSRLDTEEATSVSLDGRVTALEGLVVAGWTNVDTNITLQVGYSYFVVTGPLILTLPSSVNDLDWIRIAHGDSGLAGTTISRSGSQKINGLEEDLVLDTDTASITLVFNGNVFDWRIC